MGDARGHWRSEARELALQLLYQADLRGDVDPGDVDRHLGEASDDAKVRDYARTLLREVRRDQARLDLLISGAAENWDIGRMAVVDRNVLRLATWELTGDEIPPRVAIDEAIELVKRYSTEDSGAFVNGVLDRIRKDRDDPGNGSPPEPERDGAREPSAPTG